ncbi:hypothetical protein BGZ60DRAFT_530511 [Tricladium varicosporioides]|nr:hypothetical protein BGZ60DRAFT_530511 [Hymenoscyphus varicosporioides]
MYFPLLFTLPLLKFVSSSPIPEESVAIEPRACSTLAPDGFYLLQEEYPDTYQKVDNNYFQLYQTIGVNNRAANRHYLLVHYPATPYNSYGCSLNWNLPTSTTFQQYYGSHQLEVKTTTGYYPPFNPTWNSIIANSPATLGTGAFGTCNAIVGASGTINTEACSNRAEPSQLGGLGGGWGLGFVFKFADWVEQANNYAGVGFYSDYSGQVGEFRGPYLSYNC